MNIYHVGLWLLIGLVFGEFNMILNINIRNFNKKINYVYPIHKRRFRNWPLIMYNTLTALLGLCMIGICIGKIIIVCTKNINKIAKKISKRNKARRELEREYARAEQRYFNT